MDKLEPFGVGAETAGESRRMESLRKIFFGLFKNIQVEQNKHLILFIETL